MQASVGIALLTGLFLTVYVGPGCAGRYLVFAFWMVANLWLWRLGAKELLGRRRTGPLTVLVSAKLMWLGVAVALAAAVGIRGPRNLTAFLGGMNTPFLVMFLKAMGAAVVQRTSSPEPGKADSGENPAP
ncbi:hypothetical protein JW916_13910 [Candidatus Sumerlaeota bacterium]|nr:hypothetical protein [Candidatus Sumerlaeota bacterium]